MTREEMIAEALRRIADVDKIAHTDSCYGSVTLSDGTLIYPCDREHVINYLLASAAVLAQLAQVVAPKPPQAAWAVGGAQ